MEEKIEKLQNIYLKINEMINHDVEVFLHHDFLNI